MRTVTAVSLGEKVKQYMLDPVVIRSPAGTSCWNCRVDSSTFGVCVGGGGDGSPKN